MHPYFDLTGAGGKEENSVCTNVVHTPRASFSLKLDADNIPTGKFVNVENSGLDFRTPRALGPMTSGGHDNYLVDHHGEDIVEDTHEMMRTHWELRQVFQISTAEDCPGGEVSMKVLSNMPGFQFYTPEGFGEGQPFKKFGSFAVEPSGLIDAPNHRNFPPIVLAPNETRDQLIIYKFTHART